MWFLTMMGALAAGGGAAVPHLQPAIAHGPRIMIKCATPQRWGPWRHEFYRHIVRATILRHTNETDADYAIVRVDRFLRGEFTPRFVCLQFRGECGGGGEPLHDGKTYILYLKLREHPQGRLIGMVSYWRDGADWPLRLSDGTIIDR